MDYSLLDRLGVSQADTALLEQYGFAAQVFAGLRDDLVAGRFPMQRNVTSRNLGLPEPGDLLAWPESGSTQERDWVAAGQAAIAAGQVAVLILNGGMATRFGGVVKGVVEVLPGASFLSLKLRDVGRTGPRVPVFLMNSFSTGAETRAHLGQHANFGLKPDHVTLLDQRISLRLSPTGNLIRDEQGRPEFFAPGHGDVFEVLASSAEFQRFKDRGGRVVLISNVDNLGATLSAKVVGSHLRAGKAVTVEVAERVPGDKGGAPVRVDGRLEVLEGFRFPAEFDIGSVPVFNTNTLLVDVGAVKADYPLTWFRADKVVRGQLVVQFERLMGEVTSFVDSAFLTVPREGPEGRFLPVKTPQDLVTLRPLFEERFSDLREVHS